MLGTIFMLSGVVGTTIAGGIMAKEAGRKIFSSTKHFPEELRVVMDYKYNLYELIHEGSNVEWECVYVERGSIQNTIESTGFSGVFFTARITRKCDNRIIADETIRAISVKQLAKSIEDKFKAWDGR